MCHCVLFCWSNLGMPKRNYQSNKNSGIKRRTNILNSWCSQFTCSRSPGQESRVKDSQHFEVAKFLKKVYLPMGSYLNERIETFHPGWLSIIMTMQVNTFPQSRNGIGYRELMCMTACSIKSCTIAKMDHIAKCDHVRLFWPSNLGSDLNQVMIKLPSNSVCDQFPAKPRDLNRTGL